MEDRCHPCTLASAPAVAPSGAARAPSRDSWKGGGAAEGAVIPAATTPVCGKGLQHLVGHCLSDVLDEGAASHDRVGGACCLGDRWCGVG